jgi:hypothetical protein
LRNWKKRPRAQRKKRKDQNEVLTCRSFITYVGLISNRTRWTWVSWVDVWPAMAISSCLAHQNNPLFH